MEPQQLATKVAQLESRVATLEDEGKIVKGEVKQILTEIRTAILVRDNPFEGDGGFATSAPVAPPAIMLPQVIHAPPPPTTATPGPAAPAPAPTPRAEPAPQMEQDPPVPQQAYAKEPVMLRPVAPLQPPAPEQPQWSLLTIAGLSAWAEEAIRRLGSLRLEILLDLCEAAGHISPDARTALARVTELDLPEPTDTPSTNETVVILRQLDALVNDEAAYATPRRASL